MNYESITDRGNPFNKTGLSREVKSMLALLEDAKAKGIDVVCTSTTDHPANTASGNPSRHRAQGTDGEGLGLDCRMRRAGNDIHMEVFKLFVPYEKRLHELIYATAPYNIRGGQRVAPYARSSHHNHVHVSVNKGVFLYTASPTPDPVPSVPKEEDMKRVLVRQSPITDGKVFEVAPSETGYILVHVPSESMLKLLDADWNDVQDLPAGHDVWDLPKARG